MPKRCCVGMCRADRKHAHANSGVGMPPGAVRPESRALIRLKQGGMPSTLFAGHACATCQ